MKIVLYLHLHQPWRLARYRYVDVGSGQTYVDRERNLAIFRRIAEQSYRPAFLRLRRMLEEDSGFRFSLSVTGTWIEQAREAAPDLLPSLAAMVDTGRLSIVGETYYHSLAFLLPKPELEEEVAKHRATVLQEFGARPRVLRMTELAYSDELGQFAADHQFGGMLAEGWEGTLQGRSPTRVYSAASAPSVALLLRHYRLSDDVGFRFSSREWNEFPLTAEKYADWLSRLDGDVVNLFLDFETFGEHHAPSTGILDFLAALPSKVRPISHLGWATVEEAIDFPKAGEIAAPRTTTWADQNRDLGAWLGNDLQRSAFETAKSVGEIVRRSQDPDLLDIWRQLLTSDHFYYMYIGGHGADLGVHQYFSAYGSPYDAYATYMNALTDLRQRALRAPATGEKGSSA